MKEKVKEMKNINFLAMWKQFWNPDPEEIADEDAIKADKEISEQEKKELLKALNSNEKLANKLFKNSYKTTKLEVDKKKTIEQIKANPVKLEKTDYIKTENNEEKEIAE